MSEMKFMAIFWICVIFLRFVINKRYDNKGLD